LALAGIAFVALIATTPVVGGLVIEPAFLGVSFDKPVFLTHAGERMLYVVEQRGVIQALEFVTEEVEVYLDITDRVNQGGSEESLLGLVVTPDF